MCIHVLLLPTTGTSLSSFWHVYGLKQSGRAWYQLLSTLVECGFEQCLVDPCVFRLMVAGDYWYISFFFLARVGPGPLLEIAVSAFLRSPCERGAGYLKTPSKCRVFHARLREADPLTKRASSANLNAQSAATELGWGPDMHRNVLKVPLLAPKPKVRRINFWPPENTMPKYKKKRAYFTYVDIRSR